MIKHILILLGCLLITGCNEHSFNTGTLRVRTVIMEDKYNAENEYDMTLDSIMITFTNQSSGCEFTIPTDSNGIAEIEATAGCWHISAKKRTIRGFTEYLLNGGFSPLYFEADGATCETEVLLHASFNSRLVIEEVYFSGCMLPNNKNSYIKDQYMTLANNSSQTIYLDGMCIAQVAPSTTSKASGWMLNTDMSEIPLFLMCWQFPGKGTDYPLLPDSRQVIATNATDHTAGAVGVPASVNLSNVEWAFWNKSLTGSNITAGVKPLNLIWRSGGSSYAFTTNGPTIVVFLPESDITAWAADPAHIRTEPGNTSTMKYLHIPATWIVEIVNYVSSVGTITNSRLPQHMDVSPGVADPIGSGKAWRRLKNRVNKEVRWQDWNDTRADFNTKSPSLKEQK